MDWNLSIKCFPSSPKLMLAFVLILSVVIAFVESDSFCTKGTETPPRSITFASIIGKSFTADIYSVDAVSKVGYRAKEHYSSALKISSVVYAHGQSISHKTFHIFNWKTHTSLSDVQQGKCVVGDSKPTFGLLSLKLADYNVATYVGERTVSLEPLLLWRACTRDKDTEVSEELYTTTGLESGDARTPVPVKMVVKKRDKAGKVSQVTHHVIRFDTREDDDDAFQADLNPPFGTVCEGDKTTSIPRLPKSIMYSLEPTFNNRYTAILIVDSDKNMIIHDSRSAKDNGAHLEIESNELGVSFYMPGDDGTDCKITQYPVMKDQDKEGGILNYADAYLTGPFTTLQYFMEHIDGFTFNGEYEVRGIPCYAYTKHFDDYRGLGAFTVILYFTAHNVGVVNNVALSEKNIVRKEVWRKLELLYEHNIYDADALRYSKLAFDPLDLTECRKKLQAKDFGVLFDAGTESNQLTDVKSAVKSALAQAAGVNELRIHIWEVSNQKSKLVVLGSLLGPAAKGAHIRHLKYSVPYNANVSAEKIVPTDTGYYGYDSCLSLALKSDNVELGSSCHTQHSCTLYTSFLYNDLELDDDCDAFLIGQNKRHVLDLGQAWSNLVKAVDAGKLRVLGYTASRVTEKQSSSGNKTTVPSLMKYHKVPGSRIEKVTVTRENRALSRCADECTNSIGGECEAFTYCKNTKFCYANPNPDRSSGSISIDKDKNCDVYIRKYITEFSSYESTSAVSGTELVFEEIQDPNDCARLCLNSKDFRCESFDFCTLDEGAGGGVCSLGRQHFFDLLHSAGKKTGPPTQCTHYSRNYLGDYDRREGITSLAVRTTIQQATEESCALTCSQQSASGQKGASCSMFHFCTVGSLCEIIDEAAITSDAVRRRPGLKERKGCTTHSLKENIYRAQRRTAAYKQNAIQTLQWNFIGGQYGPGAMAGVAFAMLFLAFGVLFLGLFVASRVRQPGGISSIWRGTNPNDLAMKFSKEQFDD